MTAVWRPVVGWEGFYEVSDAGRVRSMPRPRVVVARPVKSTVDGNGYPKVDLHRPGRRSNMRVHVLVAAAFIGPRPDGQHVRHLNGDPADPRAVNLAYGTRSDNMLDAVRHGTHAKAAKTHCPAGHDYATHARLYQGRRYCRGCEADRSARRVAS